MKYNKSGYSVIVSVMIIGFLMVLTAGVFNLVLIELKDTRGESNYLKAYAAAEGAGELALLKIKEKGYAYVDKIDDSINNRSIVLAENPLDTGEFNKVKDTYLSYDFDYTVNNFSGDIPPAGYDIIPLFALYDSGEQKVNDVNLSILTGDSTKLAWNIIGESRGIAGVGNFNGETIGEGRLSNGNYFSQKVTEFLRASSGNYLILFNIDSSNNISYTLDSVNSSEYFTKPRTHILTSAQILSYRQNLKIGLDNTEFLNILRYSLYSN
ncbi:MAG: hypothetical protein PHH06_01805 [Candidatus Gracilibacteria bacterium]|nr:hypothetical protein [Candidatus Gracilibacteria bacterium]